VLLEDKKRDPSYGADVLRVWAARCGTDTRVDIGATVLADCRETLFRVSQASTHSQPFLASTAYSQRFQTWGVGTPWGCQTQIQGCQTRFRKVIQNK